LRELSCDTNRLAEVPPVLAEESLCQLQFLSLANNAISLVPEFAGQWLALKSLNMQGNAISDLPLSLRKLSRLTSLTLAHNRLDLVPLCVGEMSSLQTLDVRGKPLSETLNPSPEP
jgi:Leucine-rich repeat (LRR) protein